MDGSSTRRHGGLVLGLALVRHLVEAHGGTVRADSKGVGRGAEFTVTLPVQAVFPELLVAEHPQPSATQTEPLLASLDGVKALVVDDEADARELAALVLRASGAAVVTTGAPNTRAALTDQRRLGFARLPANIGSNGGATATARPRRG
jgi:hypothetical protein